MQADLLGCGENMQSCIPNCSIRFNMRVVLRETIDESWLKQHLFCIKYMGKHIQCHVRQDLASSVKLLSKSFHEAHCLYI